MKARQQHGTKRRNPQRSLREILQDFLTPALWKQAHEQRRKSQKRKSSRWTTQPLVLVLLFMTWCGGDSQAERFEVAKAYCQATWMCKRRGPGKTLQGFQKALQRLPLAVLRTLAAAMRRLLVQRLRALWRYQGFVPVGCDGSRVTCPRSVELEERLGAAGKDKSAPSLWVNRRAKKMKESQKQKLKATQQQPATRLYSPRKILIAIRREIAGRRRRGQPCYAERLRQARGEERPGRTSAKASRDWPRRKPHEPPKPPQLRMLSDAQKSLLARLRGKAA